MPCLEKILLKEALVVSVCSMLSCDTPWPRHGSLIELSTNTCEFYLLRISESLKGNTSSFLLDSLTLLFYPSAIFRLLPHSQAHRYQYTRFPCPFPYSHTVLISVNRARGLSNSSLLSSAMISQWRCSARRVRGMVSALDETQTQRDL